MKTKLAKLSYIFNTLVKYPEEEESNKEQYLPLLLPKKGTFFLVK